MFPFSPFHLLSTPLPYNRPIIPLPIPFPVKTPIAIQVPVQIPVPIHIPVPDLFTAAGAPRRPTFRRRNNFPTNASQQWLGGITRRRSRPSVGFDLWNDSEEDDFNYDVDCDYDEDAKYEDENCLLRRWLPGLMQVMRHYSQDTVGAMELLIEHNKNQDQQFVTGNTLRETYREVLRAVVRARGSDEDFRQAILGLLVEGLEDSDWDDRMPRLFVALAEISHQTRSHRLGAVLYQFFMDNSEEIAEEADFRDNHEAATWCMGIYRAMMRSEQRDECLLLMVRKHPQVGDWVRRQNLPGGQSLSRTLLRLQNDDRHNEERRQLHGALRWPRPPSFKNHGK